MEYFFIERFPTPLQTPPTLAHPLTSFMDSPTSSKNLFEMIAPKQAFLLGLVAAVLVLGTAGFIILGGCMLSGKCELGAGSGKGYAIAPDVAAPTGEPVPTGAIPEVTSDDWIRGDKNAPVTMIEYSDFECPFCGRFAPTVDQIMKEYSGKVRLVFRHFPLSFHPEAEPAAEAAECAGEQGKFFEYHDVLFADQTKLSAAYYPQVAAQLGLNASKFKACIDSDRALEKIRAQAAAGGSAGVTGTPGSFIIDAEGNATPIKGALPYASVKAAIDAALAN